MSYVVTVKLEGQEGPPLYLGRGFDVSPTLDRAEHHATLIEAFHRRLDVAGSGVLGTSPDIRIVKVTYE